VGDSSPWGIQIFMALTVRGFPPKECKASQVEPKRESAAGQALVLVQYLSCR
jgi:hypothetical protein